MVFIHIHTGLYIYIYIYICVCVFVCVYIYIAIDIDIIHTIQKNEIKLIFITMCLKCNLQWVSHTKKLALMKSHSRAGSYIVKKRMLHIHLKKKFLECPKCALAPSVRRQRTRGQEDGQSGKLLASYDLSAAPKTNSQVTQGQIYKGRGAQQLTSRPPHPPPPPPPPPIEFAFQATAILPGHIDSKFNSVLPRCVFITRTYGNAFKYRSRMGVLQMVHPAFSIQFWKTPI